MKKEIFVITGATYEEDTPIKQQQERAYEKVTELGFKIPREHVLIIWKDLPNVKSEKKYLGHSTERLLEAFGSTTAKITEKPLIFIDSLQSLEDETEKSEYSAIIAMARLSILHRSTNSFPIIMDREIKGYNADFSETLGNLLDQLNLPSNDDSEYFIRLYFDWQTGKNDVKTCAAKLNGISAPSFYRYISDFEDSPLYAEYLKAYQYVLKGTKKQGSAPDCIEFTAAYNQLEGDEDRDWKLLEMFPNIACTVDVPRIKLLSEKRIALLKRKGLYKKTLRAHGFTSL